MSKGLRKRRLLYKEDGEAMTMIEYICFSRIYSILHAPNVILVNMVQDIRLYDLMCVASCIS